MSIENEPYGVYFLDREKNVIFSHSNIGGASISCISIQQILEVCDVNDDEGIELIFSMKILNFVVDIAFKEGIYCVCIFDFTAGTNSSINSICALYFLEVLQKDEEANQWDFQMLNFIPNLYFELSSMFNCFTDPDFAEQFAIISPDEQVFCSFGSSKLTTKESFICWNVAKELASVVGNSKYVITEQVDFLAGFNFLNYAKIVVFFSEEAINTYDIHELADEFVKKISEIKETMNEMFLHPSTEN